MLCNNIHEQCVYQLGLTIPYAKSWSVSCNKDCQGYVEASRHWVNIPSNLIDLMGFIVAQCRVLVNIVWLQPGRLNKYLQPEAINGE